MNQFRSTEVTSNIIYADSQSDFFNLNLSVIKIDGKSPFLIFVFHFHFVFLDSDTVFKIRLLIFANPERRKLNQLLLHNILKKLSICPLIRTRKLKHLIIYRKKIIEKIKK